MASPGSDAVAIPIGYKYLGVIGAGAYARVHLLEREEDDDKETFWAVKVISGYKKERVNASGIPDMKLTRTHLKRIAREITACIVFNGCKGFVGYESMYRDLGDSDLHIVMPRINNTLRDFTTRKQPLGENTTRLIVTQLLCALKRLHGEQYAHRDLSSANVLVDWDPKDPEKQSPRTYICDFGLSRLLAENGHCTVNVVTEPYRPLELLVPNSTAVRVNGEMQVSHGSGGKVDVWSVGILMLEMLLGYKKAIADRGPDSLGYVLDQIVEGDLAAWANVVPQSAMTAALNRRADAGHSSVFNQLLTEGRLSAQGVEVLRAMLAPQISARKSCSELLEMAWFKDDAAKGIISDHANQLWNPEGRPLPEVSDDMTEEEAFPIYIKFIADNAPCLPKPPGEDIVVEAPPPGEDTVTIVEAPGQATQPDIDRNIDQGGRGIGSIKTCSEALIAIKTAPPSSLV